MTDQTVLEAVRGDLRLLSKDLQESALAAAALTLARRLDEAGPRDTAAIARELRTTLIELYRIANGTPDEEDEIESILRASQAELSKRS